MANLCAQAMKEGPIIIVSAPSGAGKTTLVRAVMKQIPELMFSVSATTRAPRPHEQEGVDYYFLSVPEFKARIAAGRFIEWEEVYQGRYYGTQQDEVERIQALGRIPLFELDAIGGIHLKQQFGTHALSIFVNPPSLDILRQRLIARGTETPEDIERRLDKSAYELAMADQFDAQIVNDRLDQATHRMETLIRQFTRL